MKKFVALITLFLGINLAGCQDNALIPELPEPVIIAVAPYNQPTLNAQLLAGYIPSEQSIASTKTLKKYDELLKQKLLKTKRQYIFLTQNDLNISIQKDSKNRPNVLTTWAKIAQKYNADFLLIPQIIDHEEKFEKGNDVFTPARLLCDFYLVKNINPETGSKDGFLQARSHYKEISSINVNVTGEDEITPRQRKDIIYFVNESILKMINEFQLTLK